MPPIRRNRPTGTPARHPKVAGTRSRPSPERFEDATATPIPPENSVPEDSVPEDSVPEAVHTAPEAVDTSAGLSAQGVLEPEAEPEPAEPVRGTKPVAKTRPEVKTKPSPKPAPEVEPAEDAEIAEVAESAAEPQRPAGWLLPAALVLVAALLTLLGFWFRGESRQAESGGSNQALVDNARTSEVVGQVTSAIQTVLSYNFAEPQKNEEAAKAVLMGKATQDYDTILTGLRKTGPEQKLVYSTIVRSAAVRVLEGDRAMVLVFADQHSERASDGYRGDTALQVVVNAQQVDGKWKITEIQPR